MDEPTLTRLRALAIGPVCTSVEFSPWLTVLLREAGGFDIYTCWRIRSGDQIVAGSASTDRVQVAAAPLMVGQSLMAIVVDEDYHGLHLLFTNDVHIETFSDSSE